MTDWIVGALCALLVSGAAYRKQSLSLSGMIAAAVMGTVYYAAGNLFWFGLLLIFFITSTAFSKFRGDRKRDLEKSYAKTGRRDAGQVFANGGIGMLACIGNALWPDPAWAWFFVGSMAAVTADTWATEWGGLSKTPPRSVLTWKPLPAGTSGGVSRLGSFAALVGALLIGAAAQILLDLTAGGSGTNGTAAYFASLWRWTVIGGFAGFAGAFADSLLGATLQRMQRCPKCGKSVEVNTHCGTATLPLRGLRWMNNDAVNVLSALAAGFIAWGLGVMLT